MILISHRGNLNGKSEDENNPEKIHKAITLGFDVEIDLRYFNKNLYLGHDGPEFIIAKDWLLNYSHKLWIHCKDLSTIEFVSNDKQLMQTNYFFHDNDHSTITSKGFLWVYPGFQPIRNSIAVMPELYNDDISLSKGICSDEIKKYK